jgi:hypothetical protein
MIEAYQYPTMVEFREQVAARKLEKQLAAKQLAAKERAAWRARIAQLVKEQMAKTSFDPADFAPKKPLPVTSFDESGKNIRRVVHVGPFFWLTHKGQVIFPAKMATKHLFYTIRMLFNNIVPPVFRVGKFKRYRDIPEWSSEYVRRALTELTKEITGRVGWDEILEDEGSSMQDQLADIGANAKVIQALKI